jgi:hypothetical protein
MQLILTFLLLLALSLSLAAGPRLGISPQRKADLQRAIGNPEDTRHTIHQLLRARVDDPAIWWDPEGENWNYGRAYLATAAAFLYQLEGNEQDARVAYDTIRAIYEQPDPDRRLPHEGYGLSRATVGLGLAYTWDWARDALSDAERDWLRARIVEALDAWPEYQHANLEAEHQGSNWVSVCRGGELILMLAAGEEKARSERYAFLKQSLASHMRNFDEIGVSQEGIGYTAYGGIFLLRALLALRDVGDTDLEAEAARHAWWRQAMYSGSFAQRTSGPGRLWLMSGVSGPAIGDEGWASLLLGFVPADDLPYFRWWYDRHLGPLSPGPEESRFDPQRDGQVWAMLLYPERVPALDPTGVYPSGIRGRAGLVFMRNRWRDQGDIQVSVHADTRHHSHAWDQPEALSIRVVAHNETWVGGPGKERDPQHFSTLLVDGRHAREEGGVADNGKLVRAEFGSDFAHVIVDGGEQYRQLGVNRVERQVLVHFHPDSDGLLLHTLDRIQSDEPHTYTWQANFSEPGERRRVVRDRRFTPVLNQPFVLMGGWPVCSVVGSLPDKEETMALQTRYGDPVRIEREGTDAELWVQLEWRCVGGRIDEQGRILEAPHLDAHVERTDDGDLRLVRNPPAIVPLEASLP